MVMNGRAQCVSAYIRAVIDAGTPDATASATVTLGSTSDNAGLAFRATDPNDFLFFRISGGGWTLGYVTTTPVSSKATTIATGAGTFSANTGYRLSATCLGASVTVSVNGTLVYTGQVATDLTGTKFGFASGVALPFAVTNFTVTQ